MSGESVTGHTADRPGSGQCSQIDEVGFAEEEHPFSGGHIPGDPSRSGDEGLDHLDDAPL
jgi:hypothetical protein